ncbi:class F sortase [Streptomyces sp. NPDC005322]|uniref:class F sortase n=1 Tax=Streptomyces sp. NPDC005322 TaxID=3157032 RepID=UPI0033A8F7FA
MRHRFLVAGGYALAMAGVALGGWLVHDGTVTRHPPLPSAAQPFTAAEEPARPAAVSPLTRSEPRRLRIPAISVDAPLTGLGLDANGHLKEPPADNDNLVAWYKDGATPGETGTAILYGHVDLPDSTAVFWKLGKLRKGEPVQVQRDDDKVALFTIDAIEVYPRNRIPNSKVYGVANRPELRLITCGGSYSRSTGYESNVVVFAHLTGVT